MKIPMSPADMHQELMAHGYICEPRLAAQVIAALTTTPTSGSFLFGKAGAGKTYLPEVLETILTEKGLLSQTMLFQQMTSGSTFDDLMYKVIPAEDTISGVKLVQGAMSLAIDQSRNGLVLLTIDEWDKTKPSADAALLDFLQHGRVFANGTMHQAIQENMLVFITMNDERVLSEPLLRRLPMINFQLPSLETVFKALSRTNPESGYINAAVVLYARSLKAGLDKPVTIQELSQLISAIDILGSDADWDMLVLQYVTKSAENHVKLSQTESISINDLLSQESEQTKRLLKAGNYSWSNPISHQAKFKVVYELPRPSDKVKPVVEKVAPEESQGMVGPDNNGYNAALGIIPPKPQEKPGQIGDYAVVDAEGAVQFIKPIPLIEYYKASMLWGKNGEIVFVEPGATIDDMVFLRNNRGFVFQQYSQSEIVARLAIEGSKGISIRWTPATGAEIIVPLSASAEFLEVFDCSNSSKSHDEMGWLHVPGIHYIAPTESVLGNFSVWANLAQYPESIGASIRTLLYVPMLRGHRARAKREELVTVGFDNDGEPIKFKTVISQARQHPINSKYWLVDQSLTILNGKALPEDFLVFDKSLRDMSSNAGGIVVRSALEIVGQDPVQATVLAQEIFHIQAAKLIVQYRKWRENKNLAKNKQERLNKSVSTKKRKKSEPEPETPNDILMKDMPEAVKAKVQAILDDLYKDE